MDSPSVWKEPTNQSAPRPCRPIPNIWRTAPKSQKRNQHTLYHLKWKIHTLYIRGDFGNIRDTSVSVACQQKVQKPNENSSTLCHLYFRASPSRCWFGFEAIFVLCCTLREITPTMKLWSKVTVLLVYSFLVSDTHGFAKIVPTYGRQHPESLSSWSSSRLLVTANLENTGTPLNDEEEESNQALLSIEYCVGCRWMLKSFWMAQELLTTFEKELDGVRVLPSSNKGVFAVKFNGEQLLWDRKEQGGFPSPKGLKQIVRDLVDPELFLGHSDTAERQSTQEEGSTMTKASSMTDEEPIQPTMSNGPQPAVTITYCTGCRWLLRAAYFGQELLMTFGDEIKSVTLVPSRPPAKGGIFVSEKCSESSVILCFYPFIASLTYKSTCRDVCLFVCFLGIDSRLI